MQGQRIWFLGAYALSASLAEFSRADAEIFYLSLRAITSLKGLELPVHAAQKADDPWLCLELLPRDWDYVITALPAVMQNLQQNPKFGLASADDSGRQAALALMNQVRQKVARLNDHCGRIAVKAVQWHSAPTSTESGSLSSGEALRLSVADFGSWDWYGAELWLEHCDSLRSGQIAAKGFLPLATEVAVLKEFALGMSLNWGRSVLEGRCETTILEHIQLVQADGLLRAVFFSGVAADDPLYGQWQDNHAPLACAANAPWQAKASLLTLDQVKSTLLNFGKESVQLGIKVQPAPQSLTLNDRISFITEQILNFDQVLLN